MSTMQGVCCPCPVPPFLLLFVFSIKACVAAMQEFHAGAGKAGRRAQELPRVSSAAHAGGPAAAASEALLQPRGSRSKGHGAAPLRASGTAGASGGEAPAADPGRSRGKKGRYSGGGRFWDADAPAARAAGPGSSPAGPEQEGLLSSQVPAAPAASPAQADASMKRRRMDPATTGPWGGPAEPGAGAGPREPAEKPGYYTTDSVYPMRSGMDAEQAGWCEGGSGYPGPIYGAYHALIPSSALARTPWGNARSPWDGTQSRLLGLNPQAPPSGALPERARWGLQATTVRDWSADPGWQHRQPGMQRDASGCALTRRDIDPVATCGTTGMK